MHLCTEKYKAASKQISLRNNNMCKYQYSQKLHAMKLFTTIEFLDKMSSDNAKHVNHIKQKVGCVTRRVYRCFWCNC